jgi:hypothetical protein
MKSMEREFVKAKNAILMGSTTDRRKIALLRRLEDAHCRRLAKDAHLRLEVKRRIAESLLNMSIFGGRNIATCRKRFNALFELGFTNIEQKAHFHLIYARAAIKQGHPQMASTLAAKMILELRRSLRRQRSLLDRQYLSHFERLAANASNAI